MEQWYAVHTKARDESLAEEHLGRQGFATFLPRIKASRRRRGRWREVIEPLFPGYLFIRLDLHTQDSSPIRSTRGVLGLVRFGDEPAQVPADLIAGLMAASATTAGIVREEHLFKPGDRVEIVLGPFAGLPASILAESGEERVQLLLELLGRANKVSISRHQIRPLG